MKEKRQIRYLHSNESSLSKKKLYENENSFKPTKPDSRLVGRLHGVDDILLVPKERKRKTFYFHPMSHGNVINRIMASKEKENGDYRRRETGVAFGIPSGVPPTGPPTPSTSVFRRLCS